MRHDVIYPQDDSVQAFVYELIYGHSGNFGPYSSAIGFLDQTGLLEAGIVFHNYYKRWQRVEASIAALNPRWLTRDRIELIYREVLALDCHAMVCSIDASNRRARKIMKALGGVEHIIADYRGPGKAECITVVTVDAFHNTIFGDEYGRRCT